MAVYFIGGPPKCGKTTLAKALSKKVSIPWMPDFHSYTEEAMQYLMNEVYD